MKAEKFKTTTHYNRYNCLLTTARYCLV